MLGGMSLVGHLTDPETGEVVPITLVIDNGGPLRSFGFETSSPPTRCSGVFGLVSGPPARRGSVNGPSRA